MSLEQSPFFPGSGGQITPPPRNVAALAAPAAPKASIAPVSTPAATAPKPAPVVATTAPKAAPAAPVKPATAAAPAPSADKAGIRAELAFNEQLLKHPKLAKGEAPKVRARIAALRAALR